MPPPTIGRNRPGLRLPAASLLLALSARLSAQSPAPAALDWASEDSSRIAFVTAHGQARQYPGVVIWALADSLDPAWFEPFEDSIAAGVRALRTLVGVHSWQRIGRRPVVYYLSPGRFISHATGHDTVFIALGHIQRGWAPFLHEAAHELLDPPAPFAPFEYPDSLEGERALARFPYWLNEGMPDYLAQAVVQATGFREGDVFDIGGLARVDSTCGARLSGHPRRAEIAARIGGTGPLDALFTTEREQVAPAFYACSQSFTRFLVDRVGVEAMVALFPGIPDGTWLAELERRAGAALPALRRAWLASLHVPDDSAN
jgi:hypothetical protein